MLSVLVRAAAVWTAIGLASGLFFREMTKHYGLAESADLAGTQLAVVHTHVLTLGTVVLLILLALTASFPSLGVDRRFQWGVWVWQAGLALTTAGMLVIGSLQVRGTAGYNSPALAGVSGMGHILLTIAFVLVFLALLRAVRALDRGAHVAAQ